MQCPYVHSAQTDPDQRKEAGIQKDVMSACDKSLRLGNRDGVGEGGGGGGQEWLTETGVHVSG